MSNYTKTTDFEAKDSLPSGDSGKIIKGAEFETEFDAISTAIATKADADGATLTGTTSFETLSDGTISVTAFVDEDDMVSDSATLVPTQQSVKAYVDSQVTAQDLDFQGDTGGALSIDLDSETLTVAGGTGIDTAGSLNTLTVNIDSTVATLTDTQTLTNKTLTSPDVNTPDIDGGTIDGTVIGGTTAAAGSFTTVSATGNITVGGTVDGRDIATDGAKLDGIEAGATADQTAAEIRTLVESALDSNVFTDADHTKLDGIEANATADQTAAEIRTLVEAATDSNVFTDADHTKLDGIEANADVTDTTNVTAAGAVMDSELTNETAVKSLDQGVATTDSPTFAGLTTTADVSFGDNDKAVFGTGSDLQIFHNGSRSVISDSGQGPLRISATNLEFKNADETKLYANAIDGGAFNIYYDNAAKLATTSTGIDVTGTAVIETGSGNTYPTASTSADNLVISDKTASTPVGITIFSDNASQGNIFFGDENDADNGRIVYDHNGNANTMSFYANGAERLSVDSTGIDVTGSISADGLTVDGSSTIATFLRDAGANGSLAFTFPAQKTTLTSLSGFKINANSADRFDIATNGDISFYESTGTTPKLFWDASAESLGIGTSSPDRLLHLNTGTTGAITPLLRLEGQFTSNTGNEGTAIEFITGSGGTEVGARIIATREAAGARGALRFCTGRENDAGFDDGNVVIDESGNLLVGTTTTTAGNEGMVYFNGSSLRVTRDSDEPLNLDRLSTDGTIAAFKKDGTTVGNIGVDSGDNLYIGGSVADHGGLYFGTRVAAPINAGTLTDDVMDLGTAGYRFKDLYLSGTANTGGLTVNAPSGDTPASIVTTTAGSFLSISDGNTTSGRSPLVGVITDDMVFYTSAGSYNERMRIDSSGNLLVGRTSVGTTGTGHSIRGGDSAVFAREGGEVLIIARNTNNGQAVRFDCQGTNGVGSIDVTTSATTYNTSSDQRLKDNIVDAPSASDDIDAIQVRSFDWKADGSHQKYGMVAQELQSVAPEAVTGDADSDDMMGVDYSKLVPMMLKEIQSLRARVAQLEGEN